MKIGVIGTGYWGRKHVDEYSKLGFKTAVSDLSKSNLQFCMMNYESVTSQNYKDILNDKEIQVVSICTPNSTHYQICSEALNLGKNVLLEKPIATNSSDAEKLLKLAEQKGLLLMVGHIFRFNNSIKKIKEIIKTKQLGTIYTINFSWTNYEPIFLDRDILFDLGVHPFDIVDNIFGITPKNIQYIGKGFRQKCVETAYINFELEENKKQKMLVNMELSWLNPIRNRRIIIVGSEKTANVDCVNQTISIINNQSGINENLIIIPNNTIRDELQYFVNRSLGKQEIYDDEPNGSVGKRIIEHIESIKI